MITEPELVGRSEQLEEVLANGNYEEYCRLKADQMPDQNGRYIWYFLKANFDSNPRKEMLNLLGKKVNFFYLQKLTFSLQDTVRRICKRNLVNFYRKRKRRKRLISHH